MVIIVPSYEFILIIRRLKENPMTCCCIVINHRVHSSVLPLRSGGFFKLASFNLNAVLNTGGVTSSVFPVFGVLYFHFTRVRRLQVQMLPAALKALSLTADSL